MANKYHQGKYKVKNPNKYWGDWTKVIYRSSWELKMFIWCDNNNDIVRWNSEEVVIPYVNPFDGRVHRYFTDVYVQYKDKGSFVYEIKPYAEKFPPKKPKRRSKYYVSKLKTYLINQAKWESADKYCRERNLTFQVITEKELGIK